MAKFSKGPWEATYVEDDGEFSIGMASYLEDPGCYDPVHHIELFDCLYPEDGEQFEEAKANMFLIAAAPDMYEALAKMRDGMNCICKFNGMLGLEVDCTKCAIDKLLAKADGTENGE